MKMANRLNIALWCNDSTKSSNLLGFSLNLNRATMENVCNEYVKLLEALIDYLVDNGYSNSQEFLDFLDKINSISVRY